MKETHLFTEEQKRSWWGEGEWVNEPDLVEFEHNGIKCAIVRNAQRESIHQHFMFGGNLCGYCMIPNNHPWCGKDFWGDETISIDVHGGITYSEINDKDPDKANFGHWIGFDCAHSRDVVPSMEHLKKIHPALMQIEKETEELRKKFPNSPLWIKSYKNIASCIEECKSMANQISDMVKSEKG